MLIFLKGGTLENQLVHSIAFEVSPEPLFFLASGNVLMMLSPDPITEVYKLPSGMC